MALTCIATSVQVTVVVKNKTSAQSVVLTCVRATMSETCLPASFEGPPAPQTSLYAHLVGENGAQQSMTSCRIAHQLCESHHTGTADTAPVHGRCASEGIVCVSMYGHRLLVCLPPSSPDVPQAQAAHCAAGHRARTSAHASWSPGTSNGAP